MNGLERQREARRFAICRNTRPEPSRADDEPVNNYWCGGFTICRTLAARDDYHRGGRGVIFLVVCVDPRHRRASRIWLTWRQRVTS